MQHMSAPTVPPQPSWGGGTGSGAGANGAPGSAGASGRDPLLLELRWECLPALLPRVGGSERLFLDLFTSHASRDLYWLDRSVLPPALGGIQGPGLFQQELK